MAQPATVIDAPSGDTLRHGSQKVTFSTAGQLICEDISWKKGFRSLRNLDEVGKPLKAAYVADWGEASMTVQLKTSTTKIALGETGSFLDTDGSTAIPFIVISVGAEYKHAEITKIPITVAEKVN